MGWRLARSRARFRGMSLIMILVVLCVVGVLVWLATTYIPMPPTFKKLIIGVAVVVTVLWLLQVFGVLDLVNIDEGEMDSERIVVGSDGSSYRGRSESVGGLRLFL